MRFFLRCPAALAIKCHSPEIAWTAAPTSGLDRRLHGDGPGEAKGDRPGDHGRTVELGGRHALGLGKEHRIPDTWKR